MADLVPFLESPQNRTDLVIQIKCADLPEVQDLMSSMAATIFEQRAEIEALHNQLQGHEDDYDGTRYENHELKDLLQDIANWVGGDTLVPVPHDILSQLLKGGFLP